MFGVNARAAKETMIMLRQMKVAETEAKLRRNRRRTRYAEPAEPARLMLPAPVTSKTVRR